MPDVDEPKTMGEWISRQLKVQAQAFVQEPAAGVPTAEGLPLPTPALPTGGAPLVPSPAAPLVAIPTPHGVYQPTPFAPQAPPAARSGGGALPEPFTSNVLPAPPLPLAPAGGAAAAPPGGGAGGGPGAAAPPELSQPECAPAGPQSSGGAAAAYPEVSAYPEVRRRAACDPVMHAVLERHKQKQAKELQIEEAPPPPPAPARPPYLSVSRAAHPF